jgi:hypothetical protein
MPGTGDINVKDEFERAKTGHDSSDWCYASLEDVKKSLSSIDYDQSKFVHVEGKVEDTLLAVLPGPISIPRLDTDWYNSTKQEMEHLMPLLVPKSELIIDDC